MEPKLIWQGSWGSYRETFRIVLTELALVVERDVGKDAMGLTRWVEVPTSHSDYYAIALFAVVKNPVDAQAAVAKLAAKVDGLPL